MLFTKPSNKTYVDLAIEFDKEFYHNLDRDDDKLYKYLYLLYYMLACKKKYFHKFEDYDAYAQFAATTVYIRFIKKEKQGEKIKSVLNYCKDTLYPLKVMYQNDTFNEVWTEDEDEPDAMKNEMKDNIQSDYNAELTTALLEELKQLPNIIKSVISQTPYKTDSLMCRELYLSCLLTLIKSFTFTTKIKNKIEQTDKNTDAVLIKNIEKDRNNSVVLWHLDITLKDYILTLTNKIRHIFSEQLEDTRNSYILDENILDAILNSAYEDYDIEENDNEEED
jgi:hypothetical protein